MKRSVVALAPHLPSHLVASLARGGPPRLPHVERFGAALLLADISGFTALTERLQDQGRQGAEELASLINRAFRPAIREVKRAGGSIVTFGGDSLFVLFRSPGAVRRAIGAAESVRRAVAHVRPGGEGAIGISQAIHFGEVVGLHLGTDDARHYLVGGSAVTTLARLQSGAGRSAIVLSARALARRARERLPLLPAPHRPVRDVPLACRYLDPRLMEALRGFRGEYRHAAILFLETRGFVSRCLQRWYRRLGRILADYDGLLLKTDLSPTGTKWLCVFGIPAAHERDADRAARAAIELLAGLPAGLHARGGLHAGTIVNVLVGTASRGSFDVLGDVVNTAARAMTEARWGEVLVTEECRRGLAGVTSEDRGTHAVRGKRTRLHLHAVKSARWAAPPVRMGTSMVGREREQEVIEDALRRAVEGHGGCVIAISGVAGIGKSTLKAEAARRALTLGFEVHEGIGVPFGGGPFHAVRGLLRHALRLDEDASPAKVRAVVQEERRRLRLPAVDGLHLAGVLGARRGRSRSRQLEASGVRLNDMIAIRGTLMRMALEKPRLLLLDDMQHADDPSRDAVAWIARSAPKAPLVMLLVHRPGFEAPAGSLRIELQELTTSDARRMLKGLVAASRTQLGALVRRAGGNPFYLEELARHLLETGAGANGTVASARLEPDMPDSIESLIRSRIDRLPVEGRRVAQLAAVMGVSFPRSLLLEVGETRAMADEGLRQLRERELIAAAPGGTDDRIFTQALVRDVVYRSILVAERRRAHRAVARVLERLPLERRRRHLAALAHHWEWAGDRESARARYLEAAKEALAAFAHEEAEHLYRSYLRLVGAPSAESVTARATLGLRVLMVGGRTADAEEEMRRALEGATRLDDLSLQAMASRGLGWVLQGRGRTDDARAVFERALLAARTGADLGEEAMALGNIGLLDREQGRLRDSRRRYTQALRLQRRLGAKEGESVVLGNLAVVCSDEGKMEEARRLYERALAIHRPRGARRYEAVVSANLAIVHYDQGRIEEARRLFESAIALARRLGDRRLEGQLLGNLGVLVSDQGQGAAARRLLERAATIHRTVENPRGEGIATTNLAVVDLEEGHLEAALQGLEAALAIHRKIGHRAAEGHALSYLAWVRGLHCGDWVVADRTAREAERLLVAAGNQVELGTCLCRQGAIALARGRDAAVLLRRARRIAESSGAGPESALGRAVDKLERAIRTRAAGGELVGGACPKDLHPEVVRWVRRRAERRPASRVPPPTRLRRG